MVHSCSQGLGHGSQQSPPLPMISAIQISPWEAELFIKLVLFPHRKCKVLMPALLFSPTMEKPHVFPSRLNIEMFKTQKLKIFFADFTPGLKLILTTGFISAGG